MKRTDNIEFYDFGEFRLDPQNRLLWRGERQIGLALKEFEVLFFLIENAGRVVEKNELLEAVWKDTFIEEGTLTQNISRLRKKLEAAARESDESDNYEKIIETLPKRGYRFLPAVTRRQIAPAAAPLIVVEETTSQAVNFEQKISPPEYFPASNAPSNLQTASQKLIPQIQNSKFKIQNSKWLWLSIIAAALIFAAVLFFLRNNPAPQKSLVAASVVPFSGAPGREDTPSFSPDGKQLAYVWNGDEGTQTDIYVRLTAGGEPVRLTETDTKEQYPVFSPDGSQIAFVRDFKTYGEVFLIPALGGTERRVCHLFSGNYSISFAPDGKSLAVIDTEDSTDKKQFAVYLVNLETGTRRRLTTPGEFRGETTPRFAPDGKSLAFVRVFDDLQHDLFVVPVESGENAAPRDARQITFDKKTIHSIAWSADGATIFFVSFRVGNRAGLWRVPANGGEPETILMGRGEITNLTISPDGKTVAFVELAPRDLDIWETTTGSEQKPQKFIASTFTEAYPVFAPDDSSVVFTSRRSGKNELWIVDRAGKNLRQLTKTDVNVRKAAFSPDGKHLAFEAIGNTAGEIFTVEIETGTTRRIVAADNSFNSSPAWSGDGRFVYFTSNRTGTEEIWKIAADGNDGNKPVQVTTRGGYLAVPAPDGSLFFNKSKDKIDFWRISANDSGENERPVPEIAALGGDAKWTANHLGIYFFLKQSEDFYDAKFYDFTDLQIKSTSGRLRFPTQFLDSPSVSADGKRFLSVTDNGNLGSIMLAVLE